MKAILEETIKWKNLMHMMRECRILEKLFTLFSHIIYVIADEVCIQNLYLQIRKLS